MKRLAALLIVLFPLVALNQPIKTNTDSLWEEFRQAETDTGKISLLNDISYKLLFTDKEDTLKMYIDSMYLWSERIGFDKGLHYAYKTRGSYYWFKHKFDSTIYFYKKAEKIAEQLKNKALIADINYNMALAYEMKGDKKEAIFHQRTAVDYFDRFNDRSGVAKSLRGLGGIYSRTGQSEKALSKILTAIHIYDSLGKQGELASTYITLGNLYTNMEEYRKAIDYHEKALKLDLKLDEVSWLPTIYNNLGNVYNSIPGKTDSAVYFLKKAIKVSEKGSKFGSKLSAYINLGNVYFEKEPEKALAWYTKAREMPLFEQGLYQKAGVIINMGGVNIDLGNLDTAKSLLYNGIRYARRGGYLNFERNAYESLIRIDSIRENIDSAMAHFNKVRQLSDSIKNENIRNRVSELEIEYETEKMEAENEQLKKENRLNQQLIQKQNYIVIISISASLILILFIIWIYISNRRVKRLNQQLEEQNQELEKLNNTKDKFFSIVAHDLKSPFNTLIGFLEELHDNYDEFTDEEKRKIIKDLKTSSENAYKMLVNLLDWARSQRGKIEIKPREIKVRNFVNEELAYVKERAGGKTQDFRNEIPETLSVYADPTMTSTVLANLINNAIKFTPRGGSIILSGSRNNGNAQILVKDTGTGIPPEKQQNLFDPGSEFRQQGTEDEKGTGLGLIICKEFINKMNGNIGVRSKPGEGSTFYFTLPAEKGKSDSQKVT